MASTIVCQNPAVDYFSLTTSRPENTSFNSSPSWSSSLYDFSLSSPESSDSINHSPTSSGRSYPTYNIPSSEDISKDQVFNFGSFDDWMGWDDPTCNAALSPEQSFFPELKQEVTSPDMDTLDPLPETGYTLAPIQNGTESNIFREDTTEEPLFQTPSQPQEQLYSTPLAWSRPSPGTRRPYNTRLSPQEESHLRAIAMPTRPISQSQSQYPKSPSTAASSPESRPQRRKRKSSVSSVSDDDEDVHHHGKQPTTRQPAPKKTAHNMIEKRYRTNLNDKIAALRDSVPSLRVVGAGSEEVRGEDLQGLTPAHKLNKATVLSKATEYIAHLEKRNKLLSKENSALKSRVEAFEILMMARGEANVGLKHNGRRSGERG